VLVEEPHMWQVEQIRRSCVDLGLAEAESLDVFRANPREGVEAGRGRLRDLHEQRARIRHIPNHAEDWLARELLALLR